MWLLCELWGCRLREGEGFFKKLKINKRNSNFQSNRQPYRQPDSQPHRQSNYEPDCVQKKT